MLFPSRVLYLLPLGWLWFTLINHLRVEWSVNPQYAYGWAVPLLCLYLLWGKAAKEKAESRKQKAEIGQSGGGIAEMLKADEANTETAGPFSFSAFQLFSFSFLAFLYLPTRLIQEANPEWRLVSWALALEVVGLTLLLLKTVDYRRGTTDDVLRGVSRHDHPVAAGGGSAEISPVSRSTQPGLGCSAFVFPICFFLVAVPWPTVIEGPLIQGLMRANIGVTIELLGVLGIPAVQHGNVIEIATGLVGIDDACSGIRSVQATLMISLFLGELYALSVRRRALCVLAGFALAFLFNVGRTLLLTAVASAKGVGAVGAWHDPAGIIILVGCFVCLWLIARALQKAESRKQKAEGEKAEGRKQKAEMGEAGGPSSVVRGQPSVVPWSRGLVVSWSLLAWLVLVEAGTELWYRSHEWRVPKSATWQVELPRDNPTFRELPFSAKTKQFLRYDEGLNGTWQQGNGRRWQAIFLRWNPGRIAAHLATSHTPEVCLTAAGRELVSQSGLRAIPVRGLAMPFCSYVVKDERGLLHVFYCLWEDRAEGQSFRTTSMTYANRLAPVLAGRRNSGQRSLEVAIWGIADQDQAEAALAQELEKLIKIAKPASDGPR